MHEHQNVCFDWWWLHEMPSRSRVFFCFRVVFCSSEPGKHSPVICSYSGTFSCCVFRFFRLKFQLNNHSLYILSIKISINLLTEQAWNVVVCFIYRVFQSIEWISMKFSFFFFSMSAHCSLSDRLCAEVE